jgi:hypothetical protein
MGQVIEDSDEQRGFYYPPSATTVRSDPLTGRSWDVPRSRHVAHLFKLPPTHVVSRHDGGLLGDERLFRLTDGAAIIHGLAFILGLRTQFHTWWFDGPVPTRCSPICVFSDAERGHVIEQIIRRTRDLPERTGKRLLGLLYAKNRASSYEWYWEQFLFQYIVFDGLYRCFADLGQVPKRPRHAERFAELANKGLIHWSPSEQEIAERCVDMRNELVHEALLAGSAPTSDHTESIRAATQLGKLNDRLMLRLAGVECGFVQSSWDTMLNFCLELKN